MKNWIVVGNSALARLLEQPSAPPHAMGKRRGSAFVHVADLVHPESLQKGSELAADRLGHVEGTGHGLGSSVCNADRPPRPRA